MLSVFNTQLDEQIEVQREEAERARAKAEATKVQAEAFRKQREEWLKEQVGKREAGGTTLETPCRRLWPVG